MVAEQNGPASPLKSEGDPHAFIPIARLVVCGNDPGKEHGYDAMRYSACPACGSYGRIVIHEALGPDILHRRLLAAFRRRV